MSASLRMLDYYKMLGSSVSLPSNSTRKYLMSIEQGPLNSVIGTDMFIDNSSKESGGMNFKKFVFNMSLDGNTFKSQILKYLSVSLNASSLISLGDGNTYYLYNLVMDSGEVGAVGDNYSAMSSNIQNLTIKSNTSANDGSLMVLKPVNNDYGFQTSVYPEVKIVDDQTLSRLEFYLKSEGIESEVAYFSPRFEASARKSFIYEFSGDKDSDDDLKAVIKPTEREQSRENILEFVNVSDVSFEFRENDNNSLDPFKDFPIKMIQNTSVNPENNLTQLFGLSANSTNRTIKGTRSADGSDSKRTIQIDASGNYNLEFNEAINEYASSTRNVFGFGLPDNDIIYSEYNNRQGVSFNKMSNGIHIAVDTIKEVY